MEERNEETGGVARTTRTPWEGEKGPPDLDVIKKGDEKEVWGSEVFKKTQGRDTVIGWKGGQCLAQRRR